MAEPIVLVETIFSIIARCTEAKNRVIQNKRKSAILVDHIEAIQPILRTIEQQELAGRIAHRESLGKLVRVVEDAHRLLQRQFKRSGYLTKIMTSSSVEREFKEIDDRLASHVRALTLSVSVLNSGGFSLPAPRPQLRPTPVPMPAPMPVPMPAPMPAPMPVPMPAPMHAPRPLFNSDIEFLDWWSKHEPKLRNKWNGNDPKTIWGLNSGVKMSDNRVVSLEICLKRGLERVPAEITQLTSLVELNLSHNGLTSLPAEIGQLTSLAKLSLEWNKLTSVPAEIAQLTSLVELDLSSNRLTSLPAEIGQLTWLRSLRLRFLKLNRLPVAIGELRANGCKIEFPDHVIVEVREGSPTSCKCIYKQFPHLVLKGNRLGVQCVGSAECKRWSSIHHGQVVKFKKLNSWDDGDIYFSEQTAVALGKLPYIMADERLTDSDGRYVVKLHRDGKFYEVHNKLLDTHIS